MRALNRFFDRAKWALACFVAGLAFAGVSPPFDFVPLAWVGLAALAYVLGIARSEEAIARSSSSPPSRARRLCEGGARGLAFGFGVNVVAVRFVPDVIARFTPLPWILGVVALVLLAAAQGLVWLIAAIVRAHLVRARVPPLFAFAIAVYASTFVPSIFPWTPAGAIAAAPKLVQLADTIGERGVSLLIALSAGAIAEAIRSLRAVRKCVMYTCIAAGVPFAMSAHGGARILQIEALRLGAPAASIALVQPSIGATDRWEARNAPAILEKLSALTRNAERRGALVTVWTESAYPYILTHAGRRSPIGEWAILQPGVRGPVIAGAILNAGHGDSYNSVLVATADGAVSEPYDKLHLLWFGESVPLAAQLPWLRRTFARGIGMVPGDRALLLTAGPVRAGILICFEDILPDAGREAARLAPNLLVDVSNDAWFTGSSESELHLRLSILRAIETRRDLVRAVNFGPTTWIDAAGITRARYADPLPGTLMTTPALLETPPTRYVRFGDWPLVIGLIAGVAALIAWGKRFNATGSRGAAEDQLPHRD